MTLRKPKLTKLTKLTAKVMFHKQVKMSVATFIVAVRIPVLLMLWATTCIQLIAAFAPAIKPEAINLPDLIPPVNTAVLALLWWRISQLEKTSTYQRDRIDDMRDHQDRQDESSGFAPQKRGKDE
jgi:hypothetical protein